MVTICLLPALYGDTILIEIAVDDTSESVNLLVDCGFNFNQGLLPKLKELSKAGKEIDRFIITHYDDDHIRNAAKFLRENGTSSDPKIIKIQQVWLNAYRHLQFSKTALAPVTEGQIKLLNTFLAINNPKAENQDIQIGGRQASIVGKEILSGGYAWNDDFKERAVCVDNKQTITITDQVTIKLLGPSVGQLAELESEFERGLKDLGIKISDSELIDDAFELYTRNQNTGGDLKVDRSISGVAISKITVESINWLVSKSKYQPDKAPGNGSSIAFILETEGKKILMLADAHAQPVIDRLKALYPGEAVIYFDAIKVSHHGSFFNNPKELFDLIDSPCYLISTNGTHPSHAHPDLETLALIIARPLRGPITKRKLIFNYLPKHLTGIFTEDLMNHFNYCAEVTQKIELV